MWAMNIEPLYKTYVAWLKNYRRKMGKGIYSHELAVKGIRDNYARQVIADYRKVNSLGQIDKKTKELFAEKIVEDIEADIKAGDYK